MAARPGAGRAGGACAEAGGPHAAVLSFGAGDRAAGSAAEPRDGSGGVAHRRHDRRPAQRDPGQPDRAADRAGGAARRAIRAGEGLDRRRDRHQYLVHAGRRLPARRAEASCPGVQPQQRAAAGRPAVSRDDRHPRSLGGRRSGCRRGRRGIHAYAEREPRGGADHHLCAGAAVLAQDPSRILRRRAACGRARRGMADEPGAGNACGRHGAGRAHQRDLRRIRAAGGDLARAVAGLRRLHHRGAGRRRRRNGFRVFGRAQEPARSQRRHRAGQRRRRSRCSSRRCWCCSATCSAPPRWT